MRANDSSASFSLLALDRLLGVWFHFHDPVSQCDHDLTCADGSSLE
jgi:hypothetical protein